jgi:hypothetical protein
VNNYQGNDQKSHDNTLKPTLPAKKILAKLNVRGRTRAVITAMEHGLI